MNRHRRNLLSVFGGMLTGLFVARSFSDPNDEKPKEHQATNNTAGATNNQTSGTSSAAQERDPLAPTHTDFVGMLSGGLAAGLNDIIQNLDDLHSRGPKPASAPAHPQPSGRDDEVQPPPP